jgi:hypothetical protein
LRQNPFIAGALVVTSSIVAVLLFVPWLARTLGHAPPTARGMLYALAAFPVVLLADRAWKSRLWRRRGAFALSESALERSCQ